MMAFTDWIIVAGYLGAIVAIVIATGRRSTLSQYLVYDRKVPGLLVLFTSLATFIGAGLIIGVIGLAYDKGWLAAVVGVAFGLGFLAVGLVAPRIRRITAQHDLRTLPQFLNWRFPSPSSRCRVAAGLVNLAAYLGLAALQYVGLSAFLGVITGADPRLMVIISGVVIITYTVAAGLRGEFITDYFQFAVIVIFVMLAPVLVIGRAGGLSALPRVLATSPSPTVTELIGGVAVMLLFLAPGLLGSMDVWQRIMACRSESAARYSMWAAGALLVLIFGVCTVLGILAREILRGASVPFPAVSLVTDVFPAGGFRGLALAGLIGAIMSTADTMVLVAGISLASDFFSARKTRTPTQLLLLNRMCVVLCGVIAIGLAILFQDIVNLVGSSLGTLTMLTPATLAALYWRKVSEAGAFWSITLGATTLYASIVIAAIIASPLIQFAVVPATLVSLAALLAGSLISPEARAEKSQ